MHQEVLQDTALFLLISFLITPGSSLRPRGSISSKEPRVFISGNITIGGLVPVHRPDKDGKCSEINYLHGVEVVEALLFSVDLINANKTLLPNITLGLKVLDSCGSEKPPLALDEAIKEFVLGETKNSCLAHSDQVIGVIGPAYSYEAEYVTTFFKPFGVPVVSYSATSPELSDKLKYKYFSRTVPSDSLQMQAIVDFLRRLNGSYVSVLYTDESYGLSAFKELKRKAEKNGICIGNEEKVPVRFNQTVYKGIIKRTVADRMPKIIVLLCMPTTLESLIKEFQKHPEYKTLQLVGSEGLGIYINRELSKPQEIATRAFFFYPQGPPVLEFNEYFLKLTPERNTRNPWFKELFQQVMNCTFENNARSQTKNHKICNSSLNLSGAGYSNSFGKFSFVPYVIDGVYALAHALQRTRHSRCGNTNKTCADAVEFSGEKLLDNIREISFNSLSGFDVNFTSEGDVSRGYNIYYFGQSRNNTYWNLIGEWKNKKLTFSSLKGKEKFALDPSVCSKTCKTDEIRQRIPEKPQCCWKCVSCPPTSVAVNQTCQKCLKGQLPNKRLRACTKIEAKHFTVDGKSISLYLAVLPVILSGLGLATIFLVVVLFVLYRNTAIVKASARELSCLLLIGLFLSFLFPFVAISRPSSLRCLCQFVLDSFPFTISYVSIAVKSNRAFRIFNPDRIITITPPFTSPKSQVVMSLVLISFQILLLLSLILLDVPRAEYIYPSSSEVHLVCTASNAQVFFSHSYNLILLIVCTYYAYKTRRVPRNFNESKFIAFSMYGSCITALAFVLVSLMTFKGSDAIRKLAVCTFRVTFMASILLFCFFVPKIYAIIFKSEENVNAIMVGSSSNGSMSMVRANNKVQCSCGGSTFNSMDTKKTASTNISF